jgi:hypothetical protein
MDFTPDVHQWAQQNFGGVDLGDPRRNRRMVDCAARIASHPEKSFPQIFDWDRLRAFYRLCDQQTATLQTVQQPHWEATRRAMGELPVALIVHDTTELDFTSHRALEGTGPIGNDKGRGFLQHNSLAFSPDGSRLLGLAYQQLKIRHPAPDKESRRDRKKRQRESLMWIEGIRATGRPPQGSLWVDVGDRGADIYEAMEASLAVGHEFLFRACQNRLVFADADRTKSVYLMDYARGLASAGEDQVEVPGRGGRPPRTVKVRLASAPVWVPAPGTTAKRASRPVLATWVVRIWEVDPPPEVKEPLEWVLLTSVATETVESMKQRRDWYGHRWGAEVYHDVEKNGCSEEARRFETAARMEACLAVLAVVSVRVYQLRLAVEQEPQADAAEVATQEEQEVVKKWLKTEKRSLTVREFVHAIAKLGGFLGRKRDGNPGIRALWRGYQRLQDMVSGYRLSRRDQKKNRSPEPLLVGNR